MQSTDLVSLLVIALGNAQVSGTRHPPIDNVEELLKLDISGKKDKYAAVRFLTKEAPEGKTLVDWLLSLEGLKQLRLIKGQLQVPEGMTPTALAAMPGGSPMMLLAVFENHCDVFQPVMQTPPPVDLKVDDLLEFLMNSPKSALIREELAKRFTHLPRTANENQWQALLRHLPEQLPAPVINALISVLSHADVPDSDRKAFEELYKARAVPAVPRFEFTNRGRVDGVPPKLDVNAISKELQSQLSKASAFAATKNLEQWSSHFRACAQIVTNGTGQADPMLGIFDECGWPKPAVNLLAGVVRSWVFGGKGSWNDVSLNADAEYQELSTQLLERVQDGIVAASCAMPRG